MDKGVQQALDGLGERVENVALEHSMRAPCRFCGCQVGRIQPSGNQDCVYCRDCGKFQYNAPRTETGREQRTLQTIRHTPPSQRYRLFERAHNRCELCGATESLTIDHILPVKHGFDFITDAMLDSDDNKMVLCAECNSGKSQKIPPPWLVAALLYRRAKQP